MRISARIFVGLLISLLTNGCLPDSELKIDLNMEPAALDDGWEISNPGNEGFDEPALREAYELFFSETEYVTGLSLIVARNGKLVAEGYTRTMKDREDKKNIQSATKSFTSMVFGIARDEGYFDGLDQKLHDIIPESFDSDLRKREITLRHLMTMNSGLDIDNEAYAQELQIDRRKNQVEYLLAKPLFADPGAEYSYRDCDPHLLGAAILKQSGMELEDIAEEHLFAPMGIADYFWERNVDGHNMAASAIYMRPRDMAKIGQLVQNRGNWEGRQLVPQDWLDQSTAFQAQFAVRGRDLDPNILPDYGFYWWIYPLDYPHLPEIRAVSAVGAGGQYIFVVQEMDLVVVMTSEPYVDGEFNLERAFFSLASIIINSISS